LNSRAEPEGVIEENIKQLIRQDTRVKILELLGIPGSISLEGLAGKLGHNSISEESAGSSGYSFYPDEYTLSDLTSTMYGQHDPTSYNMTSSLPSDNGNNLYQSDLYSGGATSTTAYPFSAVSGNNENCFSNLYSNNIGGSSNVGMTHTYDPHSQYWTGDGGRRNNGGRWAMGWSSHTTASVLQGNSSGFTNHLDKDRSTSAVNTSTAAGLKPFKPDQTGAKVSIMSADKGMKTKATPCSETSSASHMSIELYQLPLFSPPTTTTNTTSLLYSDSVNEWNSRSVVLSSAV